MISFNSVKSNGSPLDLFSTLFLHSVATLPPKPIYDAENERSRKPESVSEPITALTEEVTSERTIAILRESEEVAALAVVPDKEEVVAMTLWDHWNEGW